MGSAVLAYSGGVDSSLLLRAASGVLGADLLAVTATSATYPTGEIEGARTYARSLGVRHRIIPSDELSQDDFVRNGPDRCYHCKRELFGELRKIANGEGIAFVMDGSNTDDLSDHRPGRRAAVEFSVRSPLIEAGLNKQHVRDLARWQGLPMWDKPSLACLSSRIPYGTRITMDLLRNVQAAEDIVRRFGVRQVRVRHHQDTARIEVGPDDFRSVLDHDTLKRISRSIKELGYTYVSLDLDGYRTGSMNEGLAEPRKSDRNEQAAGAAAGERKRNGRDEACQDDSRGPGTMNTE